MKNSVKFVNKRLFVIYSNETCAVLLWSIEVHFSQDYPFKNEKSFVVVGFSDRPESVCSARIHQIIINIQVGVYVYLLIRAALCNV